MKAVVFHGIGDIRLDDVREPKIKEPYDAIVRLTSSAICGTDLHFIRGTITGMKPGTILGHEGVGVVQETGKGVRNFRKGDRVLIPSTIACGTCSYCRAGYYAKCDNANPEGRDAGTAFYGGPRNAGAINGLQAEYARVPFAHVNLVKLPDEVTDDQAILISDIFPTGYFAADMAHIHPGSVVAVFGCGPVGQFAIASAILMNAGRVLAVDSIPSRLEMARNQGAEAIDFGAEDPVDVVRELTNGIGVDRAIDAVGVDAVHAHNGHTDREQEREFRRQREKVAPRTNPRRGNWEPGDAPSQVLDWAVKLLAKAGTLSIVGVYPESMNAFPIGQAMGKNLTIRMGDCNHRRYASQLVNLVRTRVINPTKILTNTESLTSAIDAYKAFDRREDGWIKVKLEPAA